MEKGSEDYKYAYNTWTKIYWKKYLYKIGVDKIICIFVKILIIKLWIE